MAYSRPGQLWISAVSLMVVFFPWSKDLIVSLNWEGLLVRLASEPLWTPLYHNDQASSSRLPQCHGVNTGVLINRCEGQTWAKTVPSQVSVLRFAHLKLALSDVYYEAWGNNDLAPLTDEAFTQCKVSEATARLGKALSSAPLYISNGKWNGTDVPVKGRTRRSCVHGQRWEHSEQAVSICFYFFSMPGNTEENIWQLGAVTIKWTGKWILKADQADLTLWWPKETSNVHFFKS